MESNMHKLKSYKKRFVKNVTKGICSKGLNTASTVAAVCHDNLLLGTLSYIYYESWYRIFDIFTYILSLVLDKIDVTSEDTCRIFYTWKRAGKTG